MAIIVIVIGNINNETAFVPQHIRKKYFSRTWLVALLAVRDIINDTCFPMYSYVSSHETVKINNHDIVQVSKKGSYFFIKKFNKKYSIYMIYTYMMNI